MVKDQTITFSILNYGTKYFYLSSAKLWYKDRNMLCSVKVKFTSNVPSMLTILLNDVTYHTVGCVFSSILNL